MKKTWLLFCVLFAMGITHSFGGSFHINQSSSDVESTFGVGDKVINFGLGIGSTTFYLYERMRIPAISISGEYGVMDDFIVEDLSLGIGGFFGFSSSNYYTNLYLGGRAAVHYPLIENLDTYTGIMLGVRPRLWRHASTTRIHIFSSWFAGGRYYLNDNFALFGELGYGVSYLTLGLSVKF